MRRATSTGASPPLARALMSRRSRFTPPARRAPRSWSRSTFTRVWHAGAQAQSGLSDHEHLQRGLIGCRSPRAQAAWQAAQHREVAVPCCCTTAKMASSGIGTGLSSWVELRGFEPLTPSMRTRCATGLRYSPENLSQRSKLCRLLAPPRRASRRRRGASALVLVVVVLVGSVGAAGDFRVRGGVLARQAGREVAARVLVVGRDRGGGELGRERPRPLGDSPGRAAAALSVPARGRASWRVCAWRAPPRPRAGPARRRRAPPRGAAAGTR